MKIGCYACPRGAEPMRLYSATLIPHSARQHPLARLDFIDSRGPLTFR